MISLIAAIDEKNGLGFNNQLLCHLPADLKYFKEQTLNKPIIMGRKTFESIGRPLPKRQNIVITQTVKHIDGVTIAKSLDHAILMTRDAPEAMVIGGALVFQTAMPFSERLYITKIQHQFKADTFFPAIDDTRWNLVQSTLYPKDDQNAYDMIFCQFEKKK